MSKKIVFLMAFAMLSFGVADSANAATAIGGYFRDSNPGYDHSQSGNPLTVKSGSPVSGPTCVEVGSASTVFNGATPDSLWSDTGLPAALSNLPAFSIGGYFSPSNTGGNNTIVMWTNGPAEAQQVPSAKISIHPTNAVEWVWNSYYMYSYDVTFVNGGCYWLGMSFDGATFRGYVADMSSPDFTVNRTTAATGDTGSLSHVIFGAYCSDSGCPVAPFSGSLNDWVIFDGYRPTAPFDSGYTFPTPTITPTFTITQTRTATPTASPTFSVSPTETVTSTASPTPAIAAPTGLQHGPYYAGQMVLYWDEDPIASSWIIYFDGNATLQPTRSQAGLSGSTRSYPLQPLQTFKSTTITMRALAPGRPQSPMSEPITFTAAPLGYPGNPMHVIIGP